MAVARREVWSALMARVTVHPGSAMPSSLRPGTLLSRPSWPELARVAGILRRETVGGALLLTAAAVALVWANSPFADSYFGLRDTTVGPATVHLNLTVGTWAADGLLAVFFFVVGLELKREFVAGDLRDPRRAVLPVLAAVGGMVAPALVFVLFTYRSGGGALDGWATPIATDIAFALAVLAIAGSGLPAALRLFLLTLAVVDDLLAITVIAVFYTADLHLWALLAAVLPLAGFALAVQRRVRSWWALLPLALATWVLVHESGVHATVAGVLLGFTVPVVRSQPAGGPGAGPGLAEHFEHRLRPLSAGVAVPVFAFFAAGVTVGGLSGYRTALGQSITLGVILGLVIGKPVGVLGTTYLLARFSRARLDADLRWVDVLGLSLLAGVGFTVSLLIGELAYRGDSFAQDSVRVGVLTGSVTAAILATLVLRARNRVYQRIQARDSLDTDADGIPDTYQRPEDP